MFGAGLPLPPPLPSSLLDSHTDGRGGGGRAFRLIASSDLAGNSGEGGKRNTFEIKALWSVDSGMEEDERGRRRRRRRKKKRRKRRETRLKKAPFSPSIDRAVRVFADRVFYVAPPPSKKVMNLLHITRQNMSLGRKEPSFFTKKKSL